MTSYSFRSRGDLDAPDYTGNHPTPVAMVCADAHRRLFHLPAALALREAGRRDGAALRALCTATTLFAAVYTSPKTVGQLLDLPTLLDPSGARVPLCLDCLTMAAAEHEIMHQRATRPAAVIVQALDVLANDTGDTHG